MDITYIEQNELQLLQCKTVIHYNKGSHKVSTNKLATTYVNEISNKYSHLEKQEFQVDKSRTRRRNVLVKSWYVVSIRSVLMFNLRLLSLKYSTISFKVVKGRCEMFIGNTKVLSTDYSNLRPSTNRKHFRAFVYV
jgi:hypothetical protein